MARHHFEHGAEAATVNPGSALRSFTSEDSNQSRQAERQRQNNSAQTLEQTGTLPRAEFESDGSISMAALKPKVENIRSGADSNVASAANVLTDRQQKVAQQLKTEYGLTVEKAGDKFIYKLPNRNDQPILSPAEGNDTNLERISERLERVRAAKIEQLEKTYNVRVTKPGEQVLVDGRKIDARMPRLDEVYALEQGLLKSQPATMGKQVQLTYAKQTDLNFAGRYFPEDLEKPAIVFNTPTDRYEHAMLESDAAKNQPSRQGHTVESIVVHELGHHSQWKSGFGDPQKADALSREMGWEPTPMGWLMRAEKGGYFREDASNPMAPKWYHCDKEGQPLNAAGKATDRAHAQEITPEQVKDFGAVKHVRSMPSPLEMQAEGYKDFRMDAGRRHRLMQADKSFYNMIKRLDQAEIDQAYGAGKYIRQPKGNIVPNTEAARKSVEQFEK